jgi:hypothetical protein
LLVLLNKPLMNLDFCFVPAPLHGISSHRFLSFILQYLYFYIYCIYAHFLLHHRLLTLFILIPFFDMLFGFCFYMSFSSMSHSSSCLTLTHPSWDKRSVPLRPIRMFHLVQGTGHKVSASPHNEGKLGAWGRTAAFLWPRSSYFSCFISPRLPQGPLFVASQKHRRCGTAGPFLFFSCRFCYVCQLHCPLRRVLLRSSRFQACLSVPEIQSIMAWY